MDETVGTEQSELNPVESETFVFRGKRLTDLEANELVTAFLDRREKTATLPA